MEVIIVENADEVGRVAGARIAARVAANPVSVLGLATGSSPSGTYRALRKHVDAGEISFARATGFALDEYVGVPREHPQSYASVIARDVIDPLGFDPDLVHVPDGMVNDLAATAEEYDAAIAEAGGIDLQLLGIGGNGHIGFNEPTSSFASRTRVKTLAPRTRQDNARFFPSDEEVPIHCITQGLGTILEARELILVAHGEAKADAVSAAVEGPVTSFVPGSALQFHRRATVIIDEEAGSRLRLADYYRYTHANLLSR
jgi:glucosamine-6-phosphate deaminase